MHEENGALTVYPANYENVRNVLYAADRATFKYTGNVQYLQKLVIRHTKSVNITTPIMEQVTLDTITPVSILVTMLYKLHLLCLKIASEHHFNCNHMISRYVKN
jgi:hypothetical protein